MKSLGLLERRGEARTQTQMMGARTQAQIPSVWGSCGQKGDNCNLKISPKEQPHCVHQWAASQQPLTEEPRAMAPDPDIWKSPTEVFRDIPSKVCLGAQNSKS